jgi:hypothetical protein
MAIPIIWCYRQLQSPNSLAQMSFICCHLNFHANLLRPWPFPLNEYETVHSRRLINLGIFVVLMLFGVQKFIPQLQIRKQNTGKVILHVQSW